MQDRHLDKSKYFSEQTITTEKYVMPFIADTIDVSNEKSVLEIGCGEGGNLVAFLETGCKRVVGVDISEGKINNAHRFFADHPKKENISFIAANIYDVSNIGKFDIIILRDVIEHIHGQEEFMKFLGKFLNPNAKIFFGFPPWQNPFGGHQQICRSKILSKLPFFHILPKPIYRFILKLFKETDSRIKDLLEIKDTRISIERFERIVKATGYDIDKKCYYFINPNYEIKFGLKPRKALKIFSAIPYFRNYFITAVYYVISLNK